MQLIEEIGSAWGWAGMEPIEIVGENDFGNLILKDDRRRYWPKLFNDEPLSVETGPFGKSPTGPVLLQHSVLPTARDGVRTTGRHHIGAPRRHHIRTAG